MNCKLGPFGQGLNGTSLKQDSLKGSTHKFSYRSFISATKVKCSGSPCSLHKAAPKTSLVRKVAIDQRKKHAPAKLKIFKIFIHFTFL